MQWGYGGFLVRKVQVLLALDFKFYQGINHTQIFHIIDSRTGVQKIDIT